MYCTNDGKHPLSGSIGGEPIGHPVGGRDLHTHDLYGEKDAELHFWDGRESGTNQNTTPVSTVLHSPEPATADHEPKIRFQQRHQIQVGRSPVGSGGHNGSSDSTTASSPVLMQQCHHSTASAASNIVLMPSAGSHVYSTQSILADGEIVVFDDIEPNWASGGSGGLTIAEYEGSPRRFGTIYSNNYSTPDGTIRPGSNSFPRPGFPKRVETMASDDGQPRLIELGGKSNEAGNFYNKTNTMAGNDMNFQIDTKYFNCKQQVALEEDLIPAGSTSSIIKPHSFVLSPETDYRPRSFDRAKSGGISVKSDAKEILNEPCVEYEDMCNSMPILEDGLSSGHASDSEGNTVTNSCDGNGSGGRGEEAFGSLGLHMVRSDQHYHHHQQHHSTHGSAYDGSVHVQNGRDCLAHDIREALNDIKSTLQNTKTLPADERREAVDQNGESFAPYSDDSPVWVLRTMDRLPEEQENAASSSNPSERHTSAPELEDETDTDLETDRLLGHQQNAGEQNYYEHSSSTEMGGFAKPKSPNSSATLAKLKRYQTAIRADSEIYVPSDITLENLPAPAGESQPSTEVDLFISTEKIMVLNTDLKEIMMDHALRTISYIADIGQLVVLMARRRFVATGPGAPVADGATDDAGGNNASGTDVPQQDTGTGPPNTTTTDNTSPKKRTGNRTPKMICHVFESEEAQFIAQSIGQAFQVAYMEFLKANGIEDHSFMKELDYQEVLNSQEIFGDELEIFAKKELQKEVVVPKAKGEILGVVIVESGWGSMLPTVVIANLASSGAAARCGQLNIGDQIIAINGLSLVGLPLSTCQGYIKNTKNQTVVKFTVVPCAPVVEVKIKRPNTKYQLGFSVQNGVICSLLRGGIAERGGVRVGHRIIEINNQSVVAVPHEKIVNLLATSIGEILMKTMPTSMFRLLTGQENPIYI
uniref:Protein lin-10 n=1 Tax=Anopheles stephensi TaxID=30069 RepID=A0A182XXT4_ANOST